MNYSVLSRLQWICLDVNILETMPRKAGGIILVRVDMARVWSGCFWGVLSLEKLVDVLLLQTESHHCGRGGGKPRVLLRRTKLCLRPLTPGLPHVVSVALWETLQVNKSHTGRLTNSFFPWAVKTAD